MALVTADTRHRMFPLAVAISVNPWFLISGVATVLPWQLDLISQKEIRTEGLFAALNDCLYRSMYKFQYTAMVDFDEVIVPKLRRNATVLVSKMPSELESF